MDTPSYEKKITPRATDYSEWYLDIINVAELADYAPVKGCMIIKPYGYALWERVQEVLNIEFKKKGVQNAYFPLLIPEKLLKREKDHVEGFAPEVFMVTHAGGEKLEEPLVVRPTSETIMYEVFSTWIHSYRDLPLLINQWANVLRYEKKTKPFLRTSEFLWQEGHTVHKSIEEADDFARSMLAVYEKFFREYMAIPVVMGTKSESEKFAGAHSTYTCEAMMQDGKALQISTSHNLGDNFARAFNISFTDENNQPAFPFQTSWGLSTRSIGGLIMSHSDDKGLVLPPQMASIQVIIVPIFNAENKEEILNFAEGLKNTLIENNIKTSVDSRDLRPGDKYFTWEKKGVPLRIEVGPKDIANNQVVCARRDTGEKSFVKIEELTSSVKDILENIQKDLYDRALERRIQKTKSVDSYDEFKSAIEEGNFVLAHIDGTAETEKLIKEETGATIRCIPFDMKEESGICIKTGKPSNKRVIFAKAY